MCKSTPVKYARVHPFEISIVEPARHIRIASVSASVSDSDSVSVSDSGSGSVSDSVSVSAWLVLLAFGCFGCFVVESGTSAGGQAIINFL
ncbi:MAG: hypothetical protein IJH40_01345 [Ruminococcus sp.]|uniref:hypothetical protein n=1 Tax=Ruminococcus sp. TaxID=41978 RepID=UPI002872D2F7|nr:hypothetical protein [Ruminococcus sp.]MBQ3284260.1 hypothetical protein [Ruminococcus sp.]